MNKEVIEQKIQEIVQKIVKEYEPEKIILFGSWAWGEPGPDSDVDLFILKESQESRAERGRKMDALLYPRDIALDFLIYTPDEVKTSINENYNLFIEDIIRNGKVLYTRSGSDMQIPLPQRELAIV